MAAKCWLRKQWSRRGLLKSSHQSEASEDLHQQTLPGRPERRKQRPLLEQLQAKNSSIGSGIWECSLWENTVDFELLICLWIVGILGVRERGRGLLFLKVSFQGHETYKCWKCCQLLGCPKEYTFLTSPSSFKGRSQKSRIFMRSCPCSVIDLTSIGTSVSFF